MNTKKDIRTKLNDSIENDSSEPSESSSSESADKASKLFQGFVAEQEKMLINLQNKINKTNQNKTKEIDSEVKIEAELEENNFITTEKLTIKPMSLRQIEGSLESITSYIDGLVLDEWNNFDSVCQTLVQATKVEKLIRFNHFEKIRIKKLALVFDIIANNPNIQQLEFRMFDKKGSHIKFPDEDPSSLGLETMKMLAYAVNKNKGIKRLKLNLNILLNIESWKILEKALIRNTSLENLELSITLESDFYGEITPILCNIIERNTSIKSLSLNSVRMKNPGYALDKIPNIVLILQAIAKNDRLASLSFESNKLGSMLNAINDEFVKIALDSLLLHPSLTSLDISNNYFNLLSDKNFKYLSSNIAINSQLKTLILGRLFETRNEYSKPLSKDETYSTFKIHNIMFALYKNKTIKNLKLDCIAWDLTFTNEQVRYIGRALNQSNLLTDLTFYGPCLKNLTKEEYREFFINLLGMKSLTSLELNFEYKQIDNIEEFFTLLEINTTLKEVKINLDVKKLNLDVFKKFCSVISNNNTLESLEFELTNYNSYDQKTFLEKHQLLCDALINNKKIKTLKAGCLGSYLNDKSFSSFCEVLEKNTQLETLYLGNLNLRMQQNHFNLLQKALLKNKSLKSIHYQSPDYGTYDDRDKKIPILAKILEKTCLQNFSISEVISPLGSKNQLLLKMATKERYIKEQLYAAAKCLSTPIEAGGRSVETRENSIENSLSVPKRKCLPRPIIFSILTQYLDSPFLQKANNKLNNRILELVNKFK